MKKKSTKLEFPVIKTVNRAAKTPKFPTIPIWIRFWKVHTRGFRTPSACTIYNIIYSLERTGREDEYKIHFIKTVWCKSDKQTRSVRNIALYIPRTWTHPNNLVSHYKVIENHQSKANMRRSVTEKAKPPTPGEPKWC